MSLLALLVTLACLMSVVIVAANERSELRGTAEQRHIQATAKTTRTSVVIGRIKELRWINADTDKRIVIDGSNIVPVHADTDNQWAAQSINGYELPSAELSMEAIVGNGTVGSVQFTFNGQTVVLNAAPWALCGKVPKTRDFLPCRGLRQRGGAISAVVFAGKNATGASSAPFVTNIGYVYKAAPEGSIHLINSETDTDEGFLDMYTTINVTQMPKVAFLLDAWSGPYRWEALSARFDYDDGQRIVIENNRPLVFPGNNGTDAFGFTPTIGTHTLTATLHSKRHLQGQNTTWGPFTFQVVA